MFQQYISEIYEYLLTLGASPSFSNIVAHVAIYSILVYLVIAVILLFGKLTKAFIIKKSGLGIMSALFLFFLIMAVPSFIFTYQHAIIEPWGGMINYISTIISAVAGPSTITQKIILLVGSTLTILLLGVFIGLIIGGLYGFLLTFQSTIEKNGFFLGLLVGIYEIFAGFFWAVLLLAILSIGVALFLLPLIIVLSTNSGTRLSDDEIRKVSEYL